MTSTPSTRRSPGASPGGGGGAPSPVPRRSRVAIVVPIAVVVLMAGILGWAAWPVVRPMRTVTVAQAVFDRSADGGAGSITPVAAPEGRGARAEAGVSGGSPTAAGPGRPLGRPSGGVAVQAAGWLEPEPYYIACAALADGVVESMEVLEGEYVEKGQVVARLVAEDSEIRLGAAEAELEAARAELGMAEAELAAAERDWEELVDRERAVEVGRAAVAEAKAEVAQLPSQIESARATLVRLEEELKRAEASLAGQAATELTVVVARQRVAAQRAEVSSLEAREPLLEARVEKLEAEVRAAERHLELRIEERRRLERARAGVLRGRAAVARAEASRDAAALELERMVIRAPIEGYVQRRLKVPGDKVIRMMDDPHSVHLVHMYDPEQLQVRVDVPLADAQHVYVGQRCEVVVEVLPDRVFEGEVIISTHEADLQKNTLEMKVRVIDPSPLLRPEMLTRVKFLPGGEGDAKNGAAGAAAPARRAVPVLVPEETVDETGGRQRVWIVANRRGGRGVARAVAIERVGEPDEDGWVRVAGPIAPGSLVVRSFGGLREGEPVRVRAHGGVAAGKGGSS